MNILDISAFYCDSAACLVREGQVITAAQEERFTRKKHEASRLRRLTMLLSTRSHSSNSIVGTPEHAYLCVMRTNMDYLLSAAVPS